MIIILISDLYQLLNLHLFPKFNLPMFNQLLNFIRLPNFIHLILSYVFYLFYSPPFVNAPRSARWPWARLPLPPTPSAPKAGPSWRRLLRGRWSLAIIFYRLVAGASAGVTPPRMQGTAPRARKQLWGLATGCGETSPPRRVGLRCKGFARGKAAKGQPDWALFPSGCRASARLNIQYSVLFIPFTLFIQFPLIVL